MVFCSFSINRNFFENELLGEIVQLKGERKLYATSKPRITKHLLLFNFSNTILLADTLS